MQVGKWSRSGIEEEESFFECRLSIRERERKWLMHDI